VITGQSVTFTATVSVVSPGTGTPTGSVTFKDGTTAICTAVALTSGQATCTTSTLGVGTHSMTAVYSGSSSFSGSTSPALSQVVFVLGKTVGFWGNQDGHKILDANSDGALDAPVSIGSGSRVVHVTTIAQSDQIESSNSCAGVINCTGPAPNGLSAGLNSKTLQNLMGQALATTYNIQKITGYTGQSVAQMQCSAYMTSPLTGLGLSSSSTVNAVLSVANQLIGGSIAGGTTNQSQAGAMNSLLGCLNRETP
jgi:hypothetical protein